MTTLPRPYNLRVILENLLKSRPQIEALYLFGSRAYKTGSLRSDCDILVQVHDLENLRPDDLRDFVEEVCDALDLFILRGQTATSCINNSFISAGSQVELIEKLDSVLLWNKDTGFSSTFTDWVFEVHPFAEYIYSSLPSRAIEADQISAIFRRAEKNNLPTKPYIGANIAEASEFILSLFGRVILSESMLTQRGGAKGSWTTHPDSEYDIQNLIHTVIKPWIPSIEKEQTARILEGQKKIVDFSLFRGKILIEIKFIKDKDDKREVIKTLNGLIDFYQRYPRVESVIVAIYQLPGIIEDPASIELEYEKLANPTELQYVRVYNVPNG